MNGSESIQAFTQSNRPRLTWDTHTALAVIVLGALVSLAVLRGSLAGGGAVQP